MVKVFNVADVIGLAGWRPQGRKAYGQCYQRVRQAVCLGHAGNVSRMGRGFVLRKANVEKVVAYLRERYPQEVPPAPVAAAM